MRTARLITLAACAVVLLAGHSALAESESFGDPVAETVRIADLLARPDDYVERLVRVEGLVQDVCPRKGCWIDILEQQSSEIVRFKVEDDVIVFPAEARGREVVAEGVFTARQLDRDQAVAWLRHLAEEKGEDFDPASVAGPMTFYQIDGKGAVLR